MRSISAPLIAAAQSNYRKPEATITFRDTLLRFDVSTPLVGSVTQSNRNSNLVLPMDADIYPGDNTILQVGTVWADNLFWRKASTTGSAPGSVWTMGNSGYAANDNSVPGLLGGTVYYKAGASYGANAGNIVSRDWSSNFNTLGTPQGTAFSGTVTIAPVTASHIFVAEAIDDYVQFWHLDGSFARTACPRRVYGNTSFPLTSPATSLSHFFDAFSFDGVTHFIVYNAQTDGQTKVMTWKGGVWGEPISIVPPDYTQFRPHRVSLIAGGDGKVLAFLTGRMIRKNMDGWSPEFECFLYSRDGLNWTLLPRQSFLGAKTTTADSNVRGKLLVSGNFIYHLGADAYQVAPATYFVGVDNAALKEVATTTLEGFSVSYPSTKTAPEASISLANWNNYYKTTGVVRSGTDAWISAGYSGSQAQLAHTSIEGTSKSVSNGESTYEVSSTDNLFKALRNWSSPCYMDMRSETKENNLCVAMDTFYPMGDGSSWNTAGANLALINPGFETTHTSGSVAPTGWTTYSSGVTSGSFIHRTNMDVDGTDQSLGAVEVQKLSGAGTTERWGMQYGSTITALAGQRYGVSISTYVKSLPDLGEVTLEVSGLIGDNGVVTTLKDSQTMNGGWNILSVPFTNNNTANTPITIRLYVTKANAAVFGADNFVVEGDGLNALSFNQRDVEGILFSANPYETQDFDIRARYQSSVSAANQYQQSDQRVGFGLIGLAADADNYIVLKAFRNATSGSTQAAGNNLQLCKKRGGTYTTLTSGSAIINPNHDYWVRLTHQGGLFRAYVVMANAQGGADWGSPTFTYQWNDATDYLCPTANGKGKTGVWALYRPYRFHIYAIHPHALYLPLRYANDADWGKFQTLLGAGFTSGSVIVDSEVMAIDTSVGASYNVNGHSYAFKNVITQASTLPVMTAYYQSLSTVSLSDVVSPSSYHNTAFALPSYPYTLVKGTVVGISGISKASASDLYLYYCAVVTAGPALGHTWLIHRSDSEKWFISPGGWSDPKVRPDAYILWCGLDGNEAYRQPGNGFPYDLIDATPGGLGSTNVQVTPCLQVSRGVLGQTIVAHDDTSLVYYYTDDTVVLKNFQAYDYEPDYTTEDLIQRICAAAGVVNTEFGDVYNASLATTTGAAAYLSGVNQGDFDLEVDMPGSQSVYFCSSGSTGIPTTGFRLDVSTTALTLNRFVSGSAAVVQAAPLAQPVTSGSAHLRLTVNAGWISASINGASALRVFDNTFIAQTDNYLAFQAIGANQTLTNLRIPELFEWRDAIYVDNDSDAMTGLGSTTIGDRYILYLSRSGESLRFSAFDVKSFLGAYSNTLYSEVLAPDESNIVTYLRVNAEQIMEQTDPVLARRYGLMFKSMQMTKSSAALVGQMIGRIFRQVRESLERRQISMAADLQFEPEDYLTINYTTAGTGLTVEGIDGTATPSVVVNDVQYQFLPAQFEMTIGTRRYKALGDTTL